MLHDIDIVHGDLKPANVLVQKREGAKFHVAKLIDFDDSYIAGDPPGREEIAGDSLYGAPEWRRYVQGDEEVAGPQLTAAVDIFALGLMTHLPDTTPASAPPPTPSTPGSRRPSSTASPPRRRS